MLLILRAAIAAEIGPPRSPEEELKTFELEEGLLAECVASEPLVESPCAIAWNEKGMAYVVENRGYPNVAEPPLGRVARLEDTDGDGRFDRRIDFATGLSFPNGALPWRDGLLVTCAPDVVFLKDEDGDGRAEKREVVLTGFATNQSTQLRMNDPTLLPDGWIAFAGGLSGGKVKNPKRPDLAPLDLAKNDLAWHPHSGELRLLDGKSQWGHEFDDYGRRFICMNRIQVQHVVIESRYLKRNPFLAFSDTVQNCPEEMLSVLSGGEPPAARIYPISGNFTIKDAHQGTFSAAGAPLIWREGGLPERYRGRIFCCDPSANLVHWDELVPKGATFVARRSPAKREFLAAGDDWFRPVFLARGPDGALYVVDMYRKIIDHPDYMPEEIRKRADTDAGRATGRIWRVFSPSRKPAARAVPAPLAAFDSADAGAREAWLRQAEPSLRGDPSLQEKVFAFAEDADARVRFQAALTLGELAEDPRLADALAKVARGSEDDRWTRAAVLTAAGKCSGALLERLLGPPAAAPALLEETARVMLKAEPAKVDQVLKAGSFSTAGLDEKFAVCLGLGRLPEDRGLLAVARNRAANGQLAISSRLRAIHVLGLAGNESGSLRDFIGPQEADEIQLAAIKALGAEAASLLERQRWLSCSARVQEAILNQTLAHREALPALVQAIEAGGVPVSALNRSRQQTLLKSTDPGIAERAERLFTSAGGEDRMKVYAAWKPKVLEIPADPTAGRSVFALRCATCHRLDQQGVAVGPDLFDIRNQPKETILLHLIVPDREIYTGFGTFNVTTRDGRTLSGIISSESSSALTLKMAAGLQETLLRTDIATLQASEHSLMPNGLEQTMTAQEMADVLGYLRGE
ncbi:MAG: PVC-type heme-binding CxxCH protein [Verrucomicrobiales bacterium]